MRRSIWATLLAMLLALLLTQVARAASVTQTWSVGTEPFGVTIDPRDGRVYVAISNHLAATNSEYMWVIDPSAPPPAPSPFPPSTNILLPSTQVMSVLDVSLDRLFVPTLNGLAIVDVPSHSVLAVVPNGGSFTAALDPATHRVFATSQNGGLSVTDGVTGALLAHVTAPTYWAIALDPARHRVYATDLGAPSVVAFDDRDLHEVGRVALPEVPRLALAVDSARGLVYVGGYNTPTSFPGGHLYAIDEDTLSITKTIDVGRGTSAPFWITMDTDHDRLYVSNTGQYAGEIVVVDAASFAVTQRQPLPWQPGASALHPDGHLYVAKFSARLLAALSFENTTPSVSVTLDTTQPLTNDVLVASATGADVDGDALTYTYTWRANGAVRRTTTTSSRTDSFDLAPVGNGDRGQTVSVSVVASDGAALSVAAIANAVVANTGPTLALTLSDGAPRKRDVLVATANAADVDGDTLTYTYTWRVNDKVKQTTTTNSNTSSLDLRTVEAENGDSVTVNVVASNDSASASASTSATITPPRH